jgi:hypothetical protein
VLQHQFKQHQQELKQQLQINKKISQQVGGRMRKQESYMMAVGEMSPVAEVPTAEFHVGSLPVSPRMNSYSGSMYEQELQQQQLAWQQQQQPQRMRKQVGISGNKQTEQLIFFF